jgi:hypothetical protein
MCVDLRLPGKLARQLEREARRTDPKFTILTCTKKSTRLSNRHSEILENV